MRLVVIGPVWPYRGGIAQHTALLARALTDHGHDVRLLTYRRLYPRWLFPGRTVIDPSTQPVAAAAEAIVAPLWPLSWWTAARAVRRAEPDAVIVVWWVPFFAPFVVGLRWLLGRAPGRPPLVLVCHNVLPHDAGHGVSRWLTGLALRRADGWLVHATPLVEAVAALVGPRARRPGAVARAALPLHHLAPDGPPTATGAPTAARAGAASDPPTLLFFGLVRPYKGLDVLIDALALARAEVPGLRLVVAGEFWQPASGFAAQAARRGVADAVALRDGYVPNEAVAALFAGADAVVLPYRAATSSGVLTLAIEHGVPMIVTAVGGLPEVVVDGDAGLVVPPGDPAALAAAIVRLFREPGLAEALRTGARRARGRIGWDAYVAALTALVSGVQPAAAGAAPAAGGPA